MSFPEITKTTFRSWIEMGLEAASIATLAKGPREIPQGLFLGLIALPILHYSFNAAQKKLSQYSAKILSNCSDPLKERVEEIHKQILSYKIFAKAVIIGKSSALTLSSLLLLPHFADGHILLASPDQGFIRVDLNEIRSLKCSFFQRMALKICQFVRSCQKIFTPAPLTTSINCVISYLVFNSSTSRISKIGVIVAGALYSLALFYKWATLTRDVALQRVLFEEPSALTNPLPLRVSDNPSIQHGLSKVDETGRGQKKGLGEFLIFPPEVLLMILDYLPEETIDQLATCNIKWKMLCFKVKSKLLKKQFGEDLFNVIGKQLAFAPWLDLKTKVCEGDPPSQENRDYHIRKAFTSNSGYPHVKRLLKTNEVEGLPDNLIHEYFYKISIFDHFPFTPIITGDKVESTGLLFFINPTDLKGHKIVKFKDAAGRYGFALSYLFSWKNIFGTQTTPGVFIVHQLEKGGKEFAAIENQSVYLEHTTDNLIELKKPEFNFRNMEGSKQRMFLFIYDTTTSAKNNHLLWLKKFTDGKPCGPLFYGGELSTKIGFKMEHQGNYISTLALILKEFNLKP